MDPNASNQSNIPPDPNFDPGQTLVVPVQTVYSTPPPNGGTPPYQQPGQPAQNYQPPTQATVRNDRDRTLLAILLIGGGVLFLVAQFDLFGRFGNFDFGNIVLLLIGGAFMYAYFSTKAAHRIGFLIPGAILLGLGTGVFISDLPFIGNFTGEIVPLTLGLGFCLIWLLDRKHWWALIPGGILVVTGLFSTVGNLWPVALIIIGIYLLYDQSRRHTAH